MKTAHWKQNLPLLTTLSVAVLLYITCGAMYPAFLSTRIALNLISDNAFLGVVAIGLTFVILTGGIDLSVGSMVGCSSIIIAILIQKHHVHPALGLVMTIVFGTLFGSFQGLLVGKFLLPPFLVTLGGLFFLRGIGLWFSQESLEINHPFFDTLVSFNVALPGKASLTVQTLTLTFIVLAGVFVARQTRFGRSVYAIGGSSTSAELMGLRVGSTKIKVYALSGFCGALGGVLFTLYTGSGNATAGSGLELDAIATVVIGGALLSGGYGSPIGTLLGLLILGIVQTAITFQGNLSSWWTKIAIGILLLAFLLLQRALERISTARPVRS